MAKFEMLLPDEIMKDFQRINDNYEQIFGAMVDAGADVVMQNIKANLPAGIKNSDGMMSCLIKTETYKTPSDDGINAKVGFYGYFINEDGKNTPAPLVANVFEYGRSNAPFPKQPFLRKSFNKGKIEKVMLAKQREMSGGLLE